MAPLRLAAVLVVAVDLMGCASVPDDPEARAEFKETNDPLEPFNRTMFDINRFIDFMLLKPAAIVYRDLVPEPGRDAVRNFLNNLRSPVVLANDLMQLEMKRAGVTLGRFLVNSTAGIGGLFDVATNFGLEYHDEDFGQTLAVHGAGEGAYLVLPILGPANVRDGIGLVVDIFLDPLTYILANQDLEWVAFARAGVDGIDRRSRVIDVLDDIERTSLDYYATIRSLYRQRRADEIRNGEPTASRPAPGISDRDKEPAKQPDMSENPERQVPEQGV